MMSRMTTTTPVTSLDEVFLNLAAKAVMSVQFEVRVSGSFDTDRLAGAIRHAVALHPMARARLAGSTLLARRLQWEIPDQADHLALSVTDEPISVVRSRLLSRQPDLNSSPAFQPVLVRDPGGDYLLFNLHHAVFDGMGAQRLFVSIARAYAGDPDELGGPDLASARDLNAIAGSRSLKDLTPRAAKIGKDIIDRKRLTRIGADGGSPHGHQYSVTTLRLSQEETAAAVALRPKGATVNDLVLAAHVLTILQWNRDHDAVIGDSVSIMMPVNIRPAEWSTEVISNFASYLAIVVSSKVSSDLTEATAAVHKETSAVKSNGAAGWVVDLLEPANLVPASARSAFAKLLPLVEKQFVETTVLSNVGRISLPEFGDAGAVTEVWFSPPCLAEVMPVAVGVAGVGKELHITFRADRRVLSEDAAAEFAQLFRRTVTGS